MRSAILVSQVITTEYFMCVRAHTNRLERSFSEFIAHILRREPSRLEGERLLFGSCPGTSHLRTPTLTIKKCPRCGEDVEIFSIRR